jgi:YegS/Rv2252/BmrU family lipid kinase
LELLIRRALLVANPVARRASRLRAAAERAFQDAGVACDVALTERPGHAAELARERADAYDALFTLGGDGTAMEVVDALAHRATPVGVLPGGTGNLVARSLRIPLRIERAVPALLAGRVAAIDLGFLVEAGRRFAFTAGVGVDARMIAETDPVVKRRFGIAAYTLTAARVSLRRTPFRVRATVDGEMVEREAAATMVANFGTVLNDLVVLGPGIVRDDGRLDLCVFSPTTTAEAIRVAWRLFRKDFRSDAALLYRPGREFRIECDPPQVYQADGEVLGTTPFTVRVEPLAARVLIP